MIDSYIFCIILALLRIIRNIIIEAFNKTFNNYFGFKLEKLQNIMKIYMNPKMTGIMNANLSNYSILFPGIFHRKSENNNTNNNR